MELYEELPNQVDQVVIDLARSLDVYTKDIRGRVKGTAVELYNTVDAELAVNESFLLVHIKGLYDQSTYWILEAYISPNPGPLAILGAAMGFLYSVIKVVEWVTNVITIIEVLHISDILEALWPWYAEQITRFREWMGKMSDALGWGIDGLLHLTHACQIGFGVAGSIAGKDEWGIKLDWLTSTEDVLTRMDQSLQRGLRHFVGSIFSDANYEHEFFLGGGKLAEWASENLERVQDISNRLEDATRGLADMSGELSAIRTGMPYFIASNIPAAIWDGLDKFETTIYDNILPTVSGFNDILDEMDASLKAYQAKIAALEDKARLPGDLLEGVDELTGALKTNQEDKIDSIASRSMARDVEIDTLGLEGDIAHFEVIDQAMTAPTPEPGFLGIETPGRKAVTGIVEEPRETWLVGDY